jgi:uncharacterized membrane protein YfcA
VAGFTSGLLGVGGGVILVPGLVLALGYRQREAVAGSLAAIIPITLVAVGVYYFASSKHHVRLDLGLVLLVGSVVGATVGARLAHRLPDRALRIGFGVLMLLVAARLLVPG